MHEDIPILNFLVEEFTHENGRLTGVVFEKVKAEFDAKGRRNLVPTGEPDQHIPVTTCWLRSARRMPSPGSSATSGSSSTNGICRRSTPGPWPRATPRSSSAANAAFGPKNIIWAMTPTTPRCRSRTCSGLDINERPLPMVEIVSQKMGIHEWSYDNDIAPDRRYRASLRDKVVALRDIKAEVSWPTTSIASRKPSAASIATSRPSSPRRCASSARSRSTSARWTASTSNGQRRRGRQRQRLRAPAKNVTQATLNIDLLRDGEGRGRLPALRAVRRALPDRRLGHEDILIPRTRRG